MLGLCRSFALACLLQREGAETREPCTAPELPSQHATRAVHWMCTGCAPGCAQDVPKELRAPCKGWEEQEVWGAEQSWCFGPTGLALSSCFCAWSEANRLSGAVGEAVPGSLCSALVPARGTWLCRTAVPAILVTVPSSLYVSLLSLPCPVPVPDSCSPGKVMPIRQGECLTSPWPGRGAPAGYLCSVSSTLGSWERERAWAKPAMWARLGERLSCSCGRGIVTF